ncbi:hypothetical protein [uncultured Stenotrophomonas sp.]|uniref:hypothetical protein n=1 Tax=uncultured Stenotrophomonas sp. TaxID=165438 RepID=UPI00258FC9A7|nr:hypothetical protein [uncultured Stenotrophomonas sp.]
MTVWPCCATTAIYYNGLFDVPNPEGKLRISMTAQVSIVRAEAKGAVVIPSSALSRRGSGSATVRVLDSAGQPQAREVKVGIDNNVSAQITEGLAEGDKVVVGEAGGPGAAAPGGRRPPMRM